MSKEISVSRRKFLQTTGVAAGTAALAVTAITAAGCTPNTSDTGNEAVVTIKKEAIRGKMFFVNDIEFLTLSAATERIYPKDDTGPGAIELGVPYFIDNQLAGAFGHNAKEYSSAPFMKGLPTQGYQTHLLKKDIFHQGIIALNRQANETYEKDFPDLTDQQKDEILRMCESGKIAMEGIESSYFFSLLKSAVIAGVYSDPIYGGNDGMRGWKQKEYPGVQPSYYSIVYSDKFEKPEPASLSNKENY